MSSDYICIKFEAQLSHRELEYISASEILAGS